MEEDYITRHEMTAIVGTINAQIGAALQRMENHIISCDARSGRLNALVMTLIGTVAGGFLLNLVLHFVPGGGVAHN